MYLALPSPHTPILPTEEWQGKSGLNPYADFVMMVDDYVGKVLAEIERHGLTQNTIVVFTSDNGCSPEANFEVLSAKDHHPSAMYRGHKADIYEGGHRVPFSIRWPDRVQPGTVSEKTICHTDLMATLADIVAYDLKDNEGEDSFSLLPILLNSQDRKFTREATVHHSINGSFAIRKEGFKLIFSPGSGGWSFPRPGTDDITGLPNFQLYDLDKDPGEAHNLYEQMPDKAVELAELMKHYIKNGRSTPGVPQQNDEEAYGDKVWEQVKIFDLEK